MKKLLRTSLIALLVIAMAASFACRRKPSGDDPSVDIPTPVPTEPNLPLDAEVIDRFIGDWYGVYRVDEAKGVFAPNYNVSNDCAMRVAVDDFGKGVCYLQVNGMGRDDVSGRTDLFALCSAAIKDGSIDITGSVNKFEVDWSFDLVDGMLKLTEVYGTVEDHMRIVIELVRPDELILSGLNVEASDYLNRYGFSQVIDKLGGSTAQLPAVSVAEGMDPHIFFTGEAVQQSTPEPVSGRTIVSADGHIILDMPDDYVVLKNSVVDFEVAAPQANVVSVDFTVSMWNTDSLSFLLGNTPDVTELYHYTIDGFDFYGTFIETETETGAATGFKLCGTDGNGNLIIINITLDMDAFEAYSYVNVDNEAFTELILGAKFVME